MLSRVRIVLVNTSHPGNIGAVARAMKNMCLTDLVLVDPVRYPEDADEAFARASGAHDLLSDSRTVGTLEQAVADCHLVIGTSARQRTVQWPVVDPRGCASLALERTASGSQVAVVFGRERSGLTNDELALCHYLVQIPTNPDYSSLNIAMAVQVIAYEIMVASQQQKPGTGELRELITADQFEGFIDHLEETMGVIGFSDERSSEKLMRRLRRLFLRAEMDADEMNILRGIFKASQVHRVRKPRNG
jgi:tRNA (cytidine32/uridine32-2'-O)-methyltransferase